MRYGAEDFNYTFVSPDDTQEGSPQTSDEVGGGSSNHGGVYDASAVNHDSDAAGDESTKPYIYIPPKKYGMPSSSGGDGKGDDGGALIASLSGIGACCCCCCAVLLVVGGVLLAYETSSKNTLVLAGTIVLISSAGAFLLGCCTCCFSCVAACAPDGGGGGGGLFGSGSSNNDDDHRDVKVQFRRLNDRYEKAENALTSIHLNVIGDMKEVKKAQKKEEKALKEEEKRKKRELAERVKADLEAGLTTRNMCRNYRPIAFLVRFEGDMMLSNMELLRKQISIIVNCGRAGVDRAVILITSPGGAVSPYGLASSQLARIRKAGIRLIVCVDTVAASGGYMMASVGDTICAAPFAIIGSIGVVTQIPNFQKFLNKHDIDAFLFTAGKHKRTVDVIGDVTEEGKAKLQEELDDMHRAFKDHVSLARPTLKDKIEDVATGEFWMAVQAKEHGLVDEIMTSDEYLESICPENEIIEIVEKRKKNVWASFQDMARVMKGSIEGVASPLHR
mmetsp:Transcript_332/g.759  ORF Transcript_332/g.759 Transcript_332/m.759 type:complete len:503 (-) Transcript_332:65-1573(-)